MGTLAIALGSFLGFIVAYHTYGRWLARKLFRLDANRVVPSVEINDGVDYVPTRVEVLFGHHFTSIAGTGPIVGPAIAIMWGWVPALLWVLLGSIFIGAVHDFGALVVSLRNRGQTIGEVAGRLINPRAKILFLLILFLCLLIVLAIFGMVIALVFKQFPCSVIPVWLQLPLAVAIGWWTYRRKGHLFWPALIVLAIMYFTVWLGNYFTGFQSIGNFFSDMPTWIWVLILMIYCYIASVLPVTTLLQPRDYINSHQLIVAMFLIVAGIGVASFSGLNGQQLELVAPAVDMHPAEAPPIWPFLFITIACGAVSGFHSLVASGTSSKQIAREPHALLVGYGSMLTEAALAVMVICAVAAGIGMGNDLDFKRGNTTFFSDITGSKYEVYAVNNEVCVRNQHGDVAVCPVGQKIKLAGGSLLVLKNGNRVKVQLAGQIAWKKQYGNWKLAGQLGSTVAAFVRGAGNFLGSLGIPTGMAVAIMGVMVACFASTTLDTATRLQRYVVTELGTALRIKSLTSRHGATAFAVVTAGIVALLPAPGAMAAYLAKQPGATWLDALNATSGSGGLLLWPLFGASNQLLAGLAFMVITFYLLRRRRPVVYTLVPGIAMLVMPAWAMVHQVTECFHKGQWHLVGVGAGILALEAWMILEAVGMWRQARGHLETNLPNSSAAGATKDEDFVKVGP